MPGLTPQEQTRLDKLLEAIDDPTKSPGEGIGVQVLIYMFRKIVDLRDFAEEQVTFNEQAQNAIVALRQRCKALEDTKELLEADITSLKARVDLLENPPAAPPG